MAAQVDGRVSLFESMVHVSRIPQVQAIRWCWTKGMLWRFNAGVIFRLGKKTGTSCGRGSEEAIVIGSLWGDVGSFAFQERTDLFCPPGSHIIGTFVN